MLQKIFPNICSSDFPIYVHQLLKHKKVNVTQNNLMKVINAFFYLNINAYQSCLKV